MDVRSEADTIAVEVSDTIAWVRFNARKSAIA